MSRETENIERLIQNKGFQFRDFMISDIEIREASGGDPEKMIVRGTAAVFGSETLLFSYKSWDGTKIEVYEQVDPDAFDRADMTDVIFNCNHGGRVFARTRNGSLALRVNKSNGLEMEAELWDDDEGHKQLYRDIKRGNIDKMSYAYTTDKIEYTVEEDEEHDVRRYHYTVKKVRKVYDVSAVDIPAYDATEISARKMFDAESGGHEAESKRAVSLALAIYEYEKERG